MSKFFGKILSLVLTAALLLSVFSVFSFAASRDENKEESSVQLLVNRTFGEGWDVSNGITVQKKTQDIYIDYEQTADFGYNYFARFKILSEKGAYDGHIQYDFGGSVGGGYGVVEFDIKTDTMCNFGSIGYFLTDPDAAKRDYVNMYSIENNVLYVDLGDTPVPVAELRGQWIHIATVINFNQNIRGCTQCKRTFPKDSHCPNGCSADANCVLTMRTYFSESDTYDWHNAINYDSVTEHDISASTYYKDYQWILTRNNMPATVTTVRMGFPEYRAGNIDSSFCIDNFMIYNDSKTPTDAEGNAVSGTPIDGINDVEKWGYGVNVSENATKTIPIKGGAVSNSYLDEAVIMKVGSNYMLSDNKKRKAIFKSSETGEAYGAPRKIDGIVYVPFEALLTATGYPVYVHDDGISYDISTAGGSSLLTIGRDTAIVNGKKVDLTAAPAVIADPNDESNTYPAIAMDDIEKFFQGYYVTYDDMGLIIFSEGENVLKRESDLPEMLKLINSFIYEFSTTEELLEMVKENTNDFDHPYLVVDNESIDYMRSVYLGEQEDARYKRWLDDYVKSTDKLLKRFTTLPDRAEAANPTYYTKVCEQKPTKYKLLATELTNPFSGIKEGKVWTDSPLYSYVKPADENGYYYPSKLHDDGNGEHYNAGYDYAGGRNGEASAYANLMLQFATAYLFTENEDYAQIAYDIMISLCDEENWYTWPHKNYLNNAELLTPMALAYDWLYDVWSKIQDQRAEEYDLAYITHTIGRKTIYHGYETSRYNRATNVWGRDVASYVNGATNAAWNWSLVEINWNCVCNCSLVIGALAIVGERDEKIDFIYPQDGENFVEWTLCNNLWRIAEFGLTQYAPDGSYVEGPGYWSYATNYLTIMLSVLPDVFGDDLGFFEAAGLDRSYYFAVQVEYPYGGTDEIHGYRYWPFNDSTYNGAQDTEVFFMASEFLEDPSLAAIRMERLISKSAGVSWIDIVKYRPEYATLTMADVEMSLDWELQSLDGIVARSSWEGLSTFCGVMGNHNNKIQHDQVDSGNFIYSSQGNAWIIDLGADDYNIHEYWGNDIRERYYRNSAEGHNTVVVTSLQDISQDDYMPYGQSIAGGGKMTTYYDGGEAGMYAVIDNSGAYGSITNYARRGMLFTNSRETVVIQDEIAFKGVQSCAWIAHTTGAITVAPDGKTAYISQNVSGSNKCIRLTILSDNSRLKFETMSCGLGKDDFLMNGANRPGYSESMGGVSEKSRREFKRLVIKCSNSLIFNCAVVIENVAQLGDDSPVQYEYKNINKWTVEESFTSSKPEIGDTSSTVTSAKMTDIKTYSAQAQKLLSSGFALSTRSVDFFKALVRVTIAVNTYRPESFKNIAAINDAYLEYLEQIKFYEAYRSDINASSELTSDVGARFAYTK